MWVWGSQARWGGCLWVGVGPECNHYLLATSHSSWSSMSPLIAVFVAQHLVRVFSFSNPVCSLRVHARRTTRRAWARADAWGSKHPVHGV